MLEYIFKTMTNACDNC